MSHILLLIVLHVFLLWRGAESVELQFPSARYITQIQDHFDSTNQNKFNVKKMFDVDDVKKLFRRQNSFLTSNFVFDVNSFSLATKKLTSKKVF